MLKNIVAIALLALLSWLAWTSWQPLEAGPEAREIRVAVPEQPDAKPRLWRVVTRRMVWKKAAEAMQRRLRKSGLHVIAIPRRETVELHAFDDVQSFTGKKAADRAKRNWERHGFEASIITSGDRFGVALGRIYLDAHAKELQDQLKKSGRKYRYDRHMVNIHTWRFTFPAGTHKHAEKLWRRVQKLGVANPVMMPEEEFRTAFGTPEQHYRGAGESGK